MRQHFSSIFITQNEKFIKMAAFMELGMQPELSNAVDEMGWSLPTDIQQEGIPAILGGGDVLMAAETGSGKTGAFCLPIVQIVWETMRDIQMGKYKAPEIKKGWRMSIFDKDRDLGINEAGLICQATHPKAWSGARCSVGVVEQGKYYYEATVKTDGLCRMGWATSDAKLNLGTDNKSFGFGGTGKKSYAGKFDDYGESFTLHDVIGCFIDLNEATIHFSKNGKGISNCFYDSVRNSKASFFPGCFVEVSTWRRLRCSFTGSNTQESPNSESTSETNPTKRPDNAPMCVIIEPTKELAQQTYDQIELFRKFLDAPKIKNTLVSGAMSVNEQIRELKDGSDIITCTPGRVRDFLQQQLISMSHVRFFVLDEADSLVAGQSDSMRVIRELHSKIPRYSVDGQRLQMVVCSATLHNSEVTKLANEFMHFPQWIDLKGQDSVPDTVHQVVCMVDPKADKSWIRLRSLKDSGIKTDEIHAKDDIRPGSDKQETLSEAVKVLKFAYLSRAIEEHKMDKGIIFCRTKLDCDHCEEYLKTKGHSCVCLHGDRNPKERDENLKKFKEDKVKFLICTDVAARGLDVRGVPYVFNVTLPPPEEKANYVHRIGRVGRADRMGLAISLVSTVPEKVWYHQCRNRGVGCHNTNLIKKGGCAKWFDEIEALSTIEEHLGITVSRVENDFAIPVFEYEGKVTYGGKRKNEGVAEYSHAVELTDAVRGLADLERKVQLNYLKFITTKI
ncbi:ATP-dependent RNA helicase DDX1 [Aphelenchoides bicaudatus]|nr:ATP-dependent RNA helicase DDX1 [Aphelenchoides bicaudatus]